MARADPQQGIDRILPALQDRHTERTTVRDLLALHDRHASEAALDDYLCDGYLLGKNRVLRNVRARVRALGFRLSSSELSEVHGWQLMTLAYILDKKVIPYHDTVTLLRQIESAHPRHFTMRDLVRVSRPKRCGILHESAHALADNALRGQKRLHRIAAVGTERDRLFEILLGESLVAACEAFASYFGRGKIQTFLLYGYHSQVWLSPKLRLGLAEVIDSFGLTAAFELLTLGYLHYNFLYQRLDSTDVHHSLRALSIEQQPTPRDVRNLLALFNEALALNPIARTRVTFNYQYFMRLSSAATIADYLKVVDFEFRDTHLPQAHYRQAVADVAKLVLAA